MKTLKLKTIHRLLTLEVLNVAGKAGGSLAEINKLLKFIDRVDFSEEEKKMLMFRQTEDNKLVWNLRKDGAEDGEIVDVEKEIEISDEQVDMLKEIFKKRDEEKKFTTSEVSPFFELAEQIGYKFE